MRDGQVLVRFLAAGICGSDLPGFKGVQGRLPGDTGTLAAEMAGFPIHEIVGEVVATAHPGHRVGDRVVGWASGFNGLMEYVASDGNGLAPYDPALSPPTQSACSRWPAFSMRSNSFRRCRVSTWR